MQKSTLSDGQGLIVELLNYGARVHNIELNGVALALKYEKIERYLTDPFYMGASIGPIANRIADGQLTVHDQTLQMPCNEGENSLHSGGCGFDKRIWRIKSQSTNHVCYALEFDMALVGLLGVLNVEALYQVDGGNLSVQYKSHCNTHCYLNPTNHIYFNLSGENHRRGDISDHQFDIKADSYAVVDDQNIPTGEMKPIALPFKYALGSLIYPEFNEACDHHFNTGNIDTDDIAQSTVRRMVSVVSLNSGIKLDVSSNSPGFQLYTGKFLDKPFAPSTGFCVEAQFAPNAINQAGFYSPILAPNKTREQRTNFQFSQL